MLEHKHLVSLVYYINMLDVHVTDDHRCELTELLEQEDMQDAVDEALAALNLALKG